MAALPRIIPAIDIIGGQCVRLQKGDYQQQQVYHADPLAQAQRFEDQGASYLHLVDLDGARAGAYMHWDILEQICTQTRLQVDTGGGIKTTEAVQRAFNAGASQINVGSLAVKNEPLFLEWLAHWGPEKIILSADVKDGCIAIHGWQSTASLRLDDFLKKYQQAGIQYVTCTDISKDGMLQGPSHELYAQLQANFPGLKLIASGGITQIGDIHQLSHTGVFGIIIGKALYEERITFEELATYL